ncbi:MAG TPA: FAD-linked oxidase C-terminal domain-containing protein [Gaiellaceae bacterium]|nr:FAD-linked oxidase C-terminal domain-containing protein [Gaiellaceae bacterium]
MDVRARIAELLPSSQLSVSPSDLEAHSRDLSYHPARRPDVVVYPESTADVARVLAWASAEAVPVTPFGAGTSLEGHVIPVAGGISLDLTRLDRVLAVRPADLQANVQAGVLRSSLNIAAGAYGLWFTVDPGADATLGGMAATNASGTTTVSHGGMRANVLALEVVLADGTVIRPGSRTVKSSAGYDLRSLFIGSEGTLGVITELTVRLSGIPDHAVALRLAFPSLEAACRSAAGLVGAGVGVQRLELIDGPTIAVVNAYKGTRYAEDPSLFVEVAGTEASVAGDVESVRELATWEGCTDVQEERETEGRSRLWEARHHVLFALLNASPGKLHRATDVCVPVSELAAAVAHARARADELGLDAAIVAHAGDGNYHVLLMLDPEDDGEHSRVERLTREIVDWALERGGTCTGEHGIGLGKIRDLEREHADLLPHLRSVKEAFDAKGILNPGKLLRG